MREQESRNTPPSESENAKFPGRPNGIRAPHGATALGISWPDGTEHELPHEIVRGYCPCAGCQGHSGKIRFQPNGNLELRDLKAVGNYALSLVWGDGHGTGIYSFEFLFRLGHLHRELGTPGLVELEVLPRSAITISGSV